MMEDGGSVDEWVSGGLRLESSDLGMRWELW